MDYATTTIARGFAFPEGPRWHDGKFWFSDQHAERVYVLSAAGVGIEDFAVPGRPSGLGWLPDGSLLVVSMKERRLYRRRNGDLTLFADLSTAHPFFSNDMVVDGKGRAYVGNIGFDFEKGEEARPTRMVRVDPDGTVSVAADDLICPNGTVVTPDGRTLIVAESMAHRLTAFDIDVDGRLSQRRVFAELGDYIPDGICLDAEGAIWFAAPFAQAAFRVHEGGTISDRIQISGGEAYACMLGGADGRDLFICCAPHHDPKETLAMRGGRIDVARVTVGAAQAWP